MRTPSLAGNWLSLIVALAEVNVVVIGVSWRGEMSPHTRYISFV